MPLLFSLEFCILWGIKWQLTDWPLGDFNWIVKLPSVNGGRGISYEIVLRGMQLDLTDDKSTLVQGNGLVLSGNKPLPEPMLIQIYVTKSWTSVGNTPLPEVVSDNPVDYGNCVPPGLGDAVPHPLLL